MRWRYEMEDLSFGLPPFGRVFSFGLQIEYRMAHSAERIAYDARGEVGRDDGVGISRWWA